jgi:Protein of unknown function (DUF2958)
MLMLTKEIEAKLPAMYSTEKTPTDEKVLIVKYFTPWSSWSWYGAEYDPVNREFFGYVRGLDNEWGYFSLNELESITGPMGLKIERDLYFKPTKFGDLK